MNKVDVIIPIHNAHDYTFKCIESVIKNIDFNENGVILINCKNDDEISAKLKKLSIENQKICFATCANEGIKRSANDVIILDSGVEVTPGWIEKMRETAYSRKMVATVTPLPNSLKKNAIPNSLTLDEYSKIIEKCAYNENLELPTASDFCMYVRREAFDAIGYFDENNLGDNYKNDFCYRALDYGFSHLLCDNTIIFSEEEHLINEHDNFLNERYPIYTKNTRQWISSFPINHIYKNILYNINLVNRSNILILIHDFETRIGGTTLHVMDIINNLRKYFNFHILSFCERKYKLYSFFEEIEDTIDLDEINCFNIIKFYNTNYKHMLENMIKSFNIGLIHIHHMINHYADIIDISKNLNIRVITSLHDFYFLCPTINRSYNIIDRTEEEKKIERILEIKLKTGISNDIIGIWQNIWNDFLKSSNVIIAPSDSVKNEFIKEYNTLTIDVIEHGINVEKNNYQINMSKNNIYNIAFIGSFEELKGRNIFLNLVKITKNRKIKFHLFGRADKKILSKSKIKYHGEYKRSELNRLIKENNIHLVCFFSICFETYSYTLTESIAARVPVLSFDIGAIAERIHKYGFGWTIPAKSSIQDINNKINEIFSNKDEYVKKLNAIDSYHIKTVQEMCNEYYELYSKEIVRNNEREVDVYELKKLIKNNSFISFLTHDNLVNKLRNDISSLKKSKTWRLGRMMTTPLRIARSLWKKIT